MLEGAGSVPRRSAGTSRFSHLEAAPLKEATEYMEKYKRFWGTRFDKLDTALAAYLEENTDD